MQKLSYPKLKRWPAGNSHACFVIFIEVYLIAPILEMSAIHYADAFLSIFLQDRLLSDARLGLIVSFAIKWQ